MEKFIMKKDPLNPWIKLKDNIVVKRFHIESVEIAEKGFLNVHMVSGNIIVIDKKNREIVLNRIAEFGVIKSKSRRRNRK
jgi:hypothetical protein